MSEKISKENAAELGAKGGKASGEARRRKADLRKIAQAVLDGTFKDIEGNTMTGAEIFIKGLVKNLSAPSSKNWAKAVDIVTQLTDTLTAEKIKADIAIAQAKAKAIKTEYEAPEIVTDNFLEALNKSAAEDWNDENDE